MKACESCVVLLRTKRLNLPCLARGVNVVCSSFIGETNHFNLFNVSMAMNCGHQPLCKERKSTVPSGKTCDIATALAGAIEGLQPVTLTWDIFYLPQMYLMAQMTAY